MTPLPVDSTTETPNINEPTAANSLSTHHAFTGFARYVAIGDSSTEGLDDPDGQGGYRGWADRLATHLATVQGTLLYANLAIRGRRTQRIHHEQLAPALALSPDLVTLFTGTNDVVGWRFEAGQVGNDLRAMHHAIVGSGATLLTFTLPDLTPIMPLARLVAGRVDILNQMIRSISNESGAVLVDMAAVEVATDPRLWAPDRLHANADGHARIAHALANALHLPGADDSWRLPLLPTLPQMSGWNRLQAELQWGLKYLGPWAWRHLHGRSSGDGRGPKSSTWRSLTAPRDVSRAEGNPS